jgi:LuxR family maltose regulon positive regulatory protein
LGLHFYQRNDLDHAIEHLDVRVPSRYSLHEGCATSCLIGLGMCYSAQGKTQAAVEIAHGLAEFVLEAGDSSLLFESQAFRAHLSILHNDIPPALHWAQTSDAQNDPSPNIWPEAPRITRLRAFVADGSPASLHAAAPLLESTLAFARSTHNVWREVELLVIQALALRAQGEVEASLDALEQALALARPGRFVRTFLDAGQGVAELLSELARRGRQADYAGELLAHFGLGAPRPDDAESQIELRAERKAAGQTIEPLTNREVEVLNLIGQHLSNEEIAQTLFISPLTVKSHTRNLFDKLGVKRRRFAIQRARELGLLPTA